MSLNTVVCETVNVYLASRSNVLGILIYQPSGATGEQQEHRHCMQCMD